MGVGNTMAWPPTPEDLVDGNIDIPDLVYNLLAWVLCGACDGKSAVSAQKVTLSDINNRLVMSIAQDLLHCVSGGRVKTPKHVVLPMAIQTCNTRGQLESAHPLHP